MIKATQYARTSALSAIAAVLALSSTTGLAQQVQPTPTEPTTTAPTTAAPSTPAPDATSPAAQPSPGPSDTSTSDTAAPAAAAKATSTAKARRSHVVTKSAAVAAKSAAPVTHKSRTSTAAKSPKPPAPPAPAAAPLAAQATANPPAQARTPAKASSGPNDTALEIGGGALAILALGGAALAIARRRRSEDEDEWYEEQPYEETNAEPVMAAAEPVEAAPIPRHDPIAEEQAAIVAPGASAFSWGDSQETSSSLDDGSDRRPGETWVERAYRGPSPANPSVSLRNRLRRAAFFDKRERDVAEGKAVPVDAGAGLPGRSKEHELA